MSRSDGWSLYRWTDASGELLYVGISCRMIRRGREHAMWSWWMQWATTCTTDSVICNVPEPEARAAERAAIAAEAPVFNVSAAKEAKARIVAYLEARGLNPEDYQRHMPKPTGGAGQPRLPRRPRLSRPTSLAEVALIHHFEIDPDARYQAIGVDNTGREVFRIVRDDGTESLYFLSTSCVYPWPSGIGDFEPRTPTTHSC